MSYMYIRIFHIYSNIFLRLEFYRKCIRNIQLAVLTSYEFAREKNVCDLRVFRVAHNNLFSEIGPKKYLFQSNEV